MVDDLLCISPVHDSASYGIEAWIEGKLVRFCRLFNTVGSRPACGWTSTDLTNQDISRNVSTDGSVYMFPRSLIRRLTRVSVALLTLSFLLIPVIVCNIVEGHSVRMAIVVLSVAGFVIVLSATVRVKAIEILVAGTT